MEKPFDRNDGTDRSQAPTGDGMTIRPFTLADYDAVLPVLNRWWGGRNMADQLPRLFVKHFAGTCFAAERDGNLVGFVIGFLSQSDPQAAYIHFAGVDPQCRGQGVGERLYAHFCGVVKKADRHRVYSVTSVVNQLSLKFHTGIGFQVMPGDAADENGVPYTAHYDGPGEHRYCFVKELEWKGAHP